MTRRIRLRGKHSFHKILCLVSLAIGIELVCWALIKIEAQSVPPVNAQQSCSPCHSVFAGEPIRLTDADAITPEPEPTPSIPEPTPGIPEPTPGIPEPDIDLYPIYPEKGDTIGSLAIPAPQSGAAHHRGHRPGRTEKRRGTLHSKRITRNRG